LRIGRHAEGIYWEISLTTRVGIADLGSAFALRVDGGEPVAFAGEAEVAAYGSRRDIFFTGRDALAAMDRITPGARLTIDYTETGGIARRAAFPLNGLNAALIWIDGQQNRIGSERVVEAPPVGRHRVAALADLIPARLTAQHAADSDCAARTSLPHAAEITVDPAVGDGMVLYILPCWSADRNSGWKAYVSPSEDIFTNLALAEFTPEAGWTATTHLLNIQYDAADRTLVAGYNDQSEGCGTRGLWRWQPYAFRLVEFRASWDCDSDTSASTELPLVWPVPAQAN
jgi:hypothetical protein